MTLWLSIIIFSESLLFGSLLSAGEEQFLTAILVSQGLLLGTLFVAHIRRRENEEFAKINRVGVATAAALLVAALPMVHVFSPWKKNAPWSEGAAELIRTGGDLFPLAGVVIIAVAACARLLLREKSS